MGELRLVEVGEVRPLRRDDVGNLVVMADASVLPGQHAAAFVRSQCTRVGDHVVEDVARDD